MRCVALKLLRYLSVGITPHVVVPALYMLAGFTKKVEGRWDAQANGHSLKCRSMVVKACLQSPMKDSTGRFLLTTPEDLSQNNLRAAACTK